MAAVKTFMHDAAEAGRCPISRETWDYLDRLEAADPALDWIGYTEHEYTDRNGRRGPPVDRGGARQRGDHPVRGMLRGLLPRLTHPPPRLVASAARYGTITRPPDGGSRGEERTMMTATKRATYKATFQDGIAGAVLVKVARNRRRLDLGALPQEVIDYLCVERTNESAPWVFADGDFDKLVACGEVRERNRKNAPRQATAEFTVERARPSSGHAEELPRTWNDGAHCGLTDWYPELEAAITAALARGKGYAWTTGWYSSKKEIASACIGQSGGEITVEVSVSDDLDTPGRGERTIRFTNNLDRIRDAITAAWKEAEGDQRDNRVYAGFSVGRGDQWEYTLILPVGWGHEMDAPPGDYYHRWGWQDVEDGEDRPAEIPAKVAAKLYQWAENPMSEPGMKKTIGGWTIKAWEDDSDA